MSEPLSEPTPSQAEGERDDEAERAGKEPDNR